MVGNTFGRWTVIDNTSRRWLCQCDCGTIKRVDCYTIRKGLSTSCGCRSSEVTAARNRTHGLSGTREYDAWRDAKRRAHSLNRPCSKDYALRGIAMCREWMQNFDAFLRDMGPCPEGMTLERIDNNRGYERGNCCWATRTQQARNRRNVRVLTLNGRSASLPEWAEEMGVETRFIRKRLYLGWTVEKALTTPRLR